MNTESLARAIREKAALISNLSEDGTPIDIDEIRDTVELLKTLAKIVEGKSILKAFGAPGDWGHETPIGLALSAR
jgi:hypothetical protein